MIAALINASSADASTGSAADGGHSTNAVGSAGAASGDAQAEGSAASATDISNTSARGENSTIGSEGNGGQDAGASGSVEANGTLGTRDRSGSGGEDSRARLASRLDTCAAMGGVPDLFGLACCSSSCATCGGEGCADRDGGAEDCCGDKLASAAVQCGTPPCMLGDIDPAAVAERVSVCAAAGGISDATGLRCCSAACGVCGGNNPCSVFLIGNVFVLCFVAVVATLMCCALYVRTWRVS